MLKKISMITVVLGISVVLGGGGGCVWNFYQNSTTATQPKAVEILGDSFFDYSKYDGQYGGIPKKLSDKASAEAAKPIIYLDRSVTGALTSQVHTQLDAALQNPNLKTIIIAVGGNDISAPCKPYLENTGVRDYSKTHLADGDEIRTLLDSGATIADIHAEHVVMGPALEALTVGELDDLLVLLSVPLSSTCKTAIDNTAASAKSMLNKIDNSTNVQHVMWNAPLYFNVPTGNGNDYYSTLLFKNCDSSMKCRFVDGRVLWSSKVGAEIPENRIPPEVGTDDPAERYPVDYLWDGLHANQWGSPLAAGLIYQRMTEVGAAKGF